MTCRLRVEELEGRDYPAPVDTVILLVAPRGEDLDLGPRLDVGIVEQRVQDGVADYAPPNRVHTLAINPESEQRWRRWRRRRPGRRVVTVRLSPEYGTGLAGASDGVGAWVYLYTVRESAPDGMYAADVAAVVLHELGHLAGLAHSLHPEVGRMGTLGLWTSQAYFSVPSHVIGGGVQDEADAMRRWFRIIGEV